MPPFAQSRTDERFFRGVRRQIRPYFCALRRRVIIGAQALQAQGLLGLPPLPPGFSQVLILNVVEVLCFDTLLQVLIPMKLVVISRLRADSNQPRGRSLTPVDVDAAIAPFDLQDNPARKSARPNFWPYTHL